MPDEYRTRALEDRLARVSDQFPVLLLTGPRQVGKTTLLRRLCGDERRYVTLDDPAARLLANEDPGLFLERFAPPVLIDEIQYAPSLLPHIKMAADHGQPGDIWLTGSQPFHVMSGVSETLAGRVAIVRMLGLSSREADARPCALEPFIPTESVLHRRSTTAGPTGTNELFEQIWRGSFPRLIAGPANDWDLFYSSYVQTYLQRDVRDIARVGDELAFLRFLRAAAARTGQLLNYSDLARDVGVSVPTASSWLSVLEASNVVLLLQPYHSNVTKRLVKTPKLYFLDTGLCAWLTQWTSSAALEAGAMGGAMFETWVITEIIKSWWHRVATPRMYFYRDRDGREVDLLLEHDGRLHPIEIKKARTPRRPWAHFAQPLERLKVPLGHAALIALVDEQIPLRRDVTLFPAGAI